jgi:predicted protein tyrosine phosphatase
VPEDNVKLGLISRRRREKKTEQNFYYCLCRTRGGMELKMIIKIYSFEGIEELAKSPFPEKTALISIGDPGDDPPELKNKPEYILRLSFDDVSVEEIFDFTSDDNPERITEEMIGKRLERKKMQIFTKEQAEKIAAFILPKKDEIDLLICQCEYGVSRSAGCAAAISEYFYKNGIDIFADYYYLPNKRVYSETIKALREFGGVSF